MSSTDTPTPPQSQRWLWLYPAAGGAFFGLVDGASVLVAESLDLNGGQEALLMLSDAFVLGLFCLISLLPIQILHEKLRPGKLRQADWTLFLSALALSGLLDFGVTWFTDPPPHTEATPLHGNLGVYLGACFTLSGAALLLGRMVPYGRPRFFTIVGICGGLMVWGQSHPRRIGMLGTPTPDSPNVLLITLDTARADYFGAYGHPFIETPNFDALASSGVRFEQAISQIPVTGPSHTTILSGMGPWSHGSLLNGVPVDPTLPLLAEQLREGGYRTGAFISGYVLDRSVGLDRGFEVYDDDFGRVKGWARTLPGKALAGISRRLDPSHVLERRGEETVDQSLRWMDSLPNPSVGIPFFAWIHLFDPHGPYEPPAPWNTRYYEGDPRDPEHRSMENVQGVASYLQPSLEGITDVEWVLAQYGGEISYVDNQIGRLMNWLVETGRENNTLVIVAGDHGESLGEHGSWFNHGDDLFEPSSHVPLVIRLPGTLPSGVVVDDPVELTDLAPTIQEVLGLVTPDESDGISLVSSMFEGPTRTPPIARSICFDREANIQGREKGLMDRPTWRMVALRTQTSRFVWREDENFESVLFEHSTDKDEIHPVDLEPELEAHLALQARSILMEMSTEQIENSNHTSGLDTEMLEALGYID